MGKYDKQMKWQAENLKRFSFVVNKNTDQDTIDFLEREDIARKSDILRLGVQLVRLITEDLKVLTTYKADNGDEFVRIVRHDLPQPNLTWGEVKCVAVLQTQPIEHLSYYTEDGVFITTATSVHDRLGVMTEFLYTRRVQGAKQSI